MNNYADYKQIWQAAQQDKTVSITILGMGRYGTHFLKTAVWFYQRHDYRVEFNIFDMGGENGDARKRLRQECPELLSKNNAAEVNEAQYDIRFFTGIDCFGSDFNDLLLHAEKERLRRTKLVFIALGDDDKNIHASMMVRTLFDQQQVEAAREVTDLPFIYAVVYDDLKASNLNTSGLENYKSEKYQIRFVGAFSDQYSYKIIDENRRREKAAFKYHLDWVRKESQLRNCYEIAENDREHPNWALCMKFKKMLDKELAADGKAPITWGDADYFKQPDKKVDYNGHVNIDTYKKTAEQYMRFAYFRQSSIAKSDHKEALEKVTDTKSQDAEICNCATCQSKRITEHMRWNAYMRSLGYRYYGDVRSVRGKLHPDLQAWDKLSCRERYKD